MSGLGGGGQVRKDGQGGGACDTKAVLVGVLEKNKPIGERKITDCKELAHPIIEKSQALQLADRRPTRADGAFQSEGEKPMSQLSVPTCGG